MCAVPSGLDPAVVSGIDARLAGVEADHGVRILWAIESGSRAWGFPSPDSDYDCRFLYVRPRDAYLSLWPERDVIETPLDETYDVSGWDLAKAVRLLVKGNATAVEWLRSPIVYSGDEGFRDRALALAAEVVDREALCRHYLHVAQQQKSRPHTLKRFFYALRPAAALRWLAAHPESAVPPMELRALLREASAEPAVQDAAEEFIALKSVTRELGASEPPGVLTRFVEAELTRAAEREAGRDAAVRSGEQCAAPGGGAGYHGPQHAGTDQGSSRQDAARARADAFFRAELDIWSAG